jgi:hypothetical protein
MTSASVATSRPTLRRVRVTCLDEELKEAMAFQEVGDDVTIICGGLSPLDS